MDAAYLAGILDGEGCISIVRERRPSRKQKYPTFQLRITVGLTYEPLIMALFEQWGGSKQKRRVQLGWKACHVWTICGASASEVLREAIPFLQIKREQALLALAFQSGKQEKGGTQRTAEERGRQEAAWQHMKEMNKRGS